MAAEVVMRPASEEDAVRLAANLRPVEVEELRAATGQEPLPCILEGLDMSSEAWAVYIGGELACVWGVVPMRQGLLTGRSGVAWLLSTHAVERWPIAFWKLCLRVVPELLKRWDEIVNAIDVRHQQSVRWARRLGFKLEEPRPFGVAGLDFHRWRATLEDVCAHP